MGLVIVNLVELEEKWRWYKSGGKRAAGQSRWSSTSVKRPG